MGKKSFSRQDPQIDDDPNARRVGYGNYLESGEPGTGGLNDTIPESSLDRTNILNGDRSVDRQRVPAKKSGKRAIMTKHFAELEHLDPIFIELESSKDWQRRMSCIESLLGIIEGSKEKVSQSKYLVKTFDSFMTLAHDPNHKVQTLALRVFNERILETFKTNINESCLTPTLASLFN